MSTLMDTTFNTEGIAASVSDGAVDISSVPECDGIGSSECRELATWLNEAADCIDENSERDLANARLFGKPPVVVCDGYVAWLCGTVEVRLSKNAEGYSFTAAIRIMVVGTYLDVSITEGSIGETVLRVGRILGVLSDSLDEMRKSDD